MWVLYTTLYFSWDKNVFKKMHNKNGLGAKGFYLH